tara:strand:+ start:2641 stop:3279 length:639 start_codon:yes stop_codon:yes gene_type:complete
MKKLLLNEETTRRFMKLANIDNLSESFVDSIEEEIEEAMHAKEEGMHDKDKMEEAEEVVEESEEIVEEDSLEEAAHEDDKMEEDYMEEEMEDKPEGGQPSAEDIVTAVVDALDDLFPGEKLTVTSDEADDAGMDMPADDADDMDDMDDMDAMAPAGDMGGDMDDTPADDDMEEAMYEQLEEANINVLDEKDTEWLVNEALRRVTKRLLEKAN